MSNSKRSIKGKMNGQRRQFLKSSGLLLSFTIAGESVLLSPAQARDNDVPLQVLTEPQVKVAQWLAEQLVPGAQEAGIAHYIDSQLDAKPQDSLLMLRYLGVPAPYQGFYQAALDSVAKTISQRYAKSVDQLAQLSLAQVEDYIGALAQSKIENWQGPPAGFFYFVLRADAVDVVYGTEQGFDHIDMPYMAHIKPTENW